MTINQPEYVQDSTELQLNINSTFFPIWTHKIFFIVLYFITGITEEL